MPSHLPLAQSAALLQLWPFFSLQLPPPSQTSLLPHTGILSVCPSGMFEHIPAEPLMLQDLQSPSHTSLQQTVSTQLPLSHSLALPQVVPLHFLHEPPQSTPVSSPFFMLSLHETHVPLKQVCAAAPQSPLTMQSTHVPFMSHFRLTSHVDPVCARSLTGMPLLQVSRVQSLPSLGGVSAS